MPRQGSRPEASGLMPHTGVASQASVSTHDGGDGATNASTAPAHGTIASQGRKSRKAISRSTPHHPARTPTAAGSAVGSGPQHHPQGARAEAGHAPPHNRFDPMAGVTGRQAASRTGHRSAGAGTGVSPGVGAGAGQTRSSPSATGSASLPTAEEVPGRGASATHSGAARQTPQHTTGRTHAAGGPVDTVGENPVVGMPTTSSSPPPPSPSHALRDRIRPTSSAAAHAGHPTAPTYGQYTVTAMAAAAVGVGKAMTAAYQATQPPSRREARDPFERPPYALSLEIMSVYKSINVRFCTETRQKLPGSSQYNNGYDDREGHYLPIIGEEIAGRYTVQEVLGKGSFGTVLQCCDGKYQLPVAVKVVRRGAYFEAQGRLEAEIVAYLNRLPSLESLIVQLRKVLIWKEHVVLVFELLSFDLYQLIRCTRCNGVSLDLTRKFALQLLKVFSQLEQHDPPIVHCDLKPENVLLRDPSRSGIRVIDFGSACYERQSAESMPYAQEKRRLESLREAHEGRIPLDELCADVPQASVYHVMPKYVQSRFYRSPEVILELGYTSAIDRWSLGCMLVELHTGVPLFPGRNEADMLALFTAVLGPLPTYMITASPKRSVFYNLTPASAFPRAPSPNETTGALGGSGSGGGDVDEVATGPARVSSSLFAAAAAAWGGGCGSPPVSSVDGGGTSQATSYVGGPTGTQGSPMFAAVGTTPPPTFSGWSIPHGEHRRRESATQRATQGSASPASIAVSHASPGAAAPGAATSLPTRGLYYPNDAHLQLWSGPQDHNKAALAPLKDTLGVYSGGPRGCRRGQKGHEPAAYECFLDFIRKLLAFDPRERMTCAQALAHPFLQPLLELEAAAQRQQQQQQQQQRFTSSPAT